MSKDWTPEELAAASSVMKAATKSFVPHRS